ARPRRTWPRPAVRTRRSAPRPVRPPCGAARRSRPPWPRSTPVPGRAQRTGRWCRSTGTDTAIPSRRSWPSPRRLAPYHGDGLPGVHQDGVAHPCRYQGHADRLLALAGVDHGHRVVEQPHHPDLHGHIGAGDADSLSALAHVTTPGPSTPGCSKNTCTSSHSTWYAVTCSSLTTRGSADGVTMR